MVWTPPSDLPPPPPNRLRGISHVPLHHCRHPDQRCGLGMYHSKRPDAAGRGDLTDLPACSCLDPLGSRLAPCTALPTQAPPTKICLHCIQALQRCSAAGNGTQHLRRGGLTSDSAKYDTRHDAAAVIQMLLDVEQESSPLSIHKICEEGRPYGYVKSSAPPPPPSPVHHQRHR